MVEFIGVFSTKLTAQDHASLMGGLNKNSFIVEGTTFFETEPLNLFFVGLSLEEDFGQKWKLNTFIQYVQKGGKLQVPSSSFLSPSNLRFQFVDVVPSIEYKISDFFGIYAGGQVGYLIRADQKLNKTYSKVTQEFFEKINYGLVLGLKLYAGNSGFNFHWDRGQKNLIKEGDGIPAQGFELYQQSFQLGFTLYL
jgi:hypothetical protein